MRRELIETTHKLAKELNVKGLINIQFVLYEDQLYVIEVNPRSSRTVPYISKVTGVPMIDLATRAALGERIAGMGFGTGLYPKRAITAIKVPVFSFEKLPDVEVSLGPEMKSTGEVLGVSYDYSEALLKGLMASGMSIPHDGGGGVLFTVSDNDKQELIPIAAVFDYLGYDIYATPGTAHVLNFNFVAANAVHKIGCGTPNIEDLFEQKKLRLIVNTPTRGRRNMRDGFKIRRMAVEKRIPCITSLDTAKVLLESLKLKKTEADILPINLKEVLGNKQS